MMMRWSWIGLPLLLLRATAGCLLNPLGYFKELAYFAVALWLGSSVLTSINQEWYGESRRAAAAAATDGGVISRVILNPCDDTLCVFRDFREVVVLDRETHEELDRYPVPTVDRLEFGSNASGWSFLTLISGQRVEWRHSVFGAISLPADQGPYPLVDASLSPDGNSAAAVAASGLVRCWRLRDDGTVGERQWSLSQTPCRVLLSSQGQYLAVQSVESDLRFFDAESGEQLTAPVGISGILVAWAWSAEGERLATATQVGSIAVWNAGRSEPLEWTTSLKSLPTAVALTPDGSQLVVGTTSGEIIAYRDGRLNWSQPTHPALVRMLSFTDRGESILTGSIKGLVAEQSASTGTVLRKFDAAALR